MNNNCFFELAWVGWEDYEPIFFSGPEECTQESFLEICNKIVPEASLVVLAKHNSAEFQGFIGWTEIIEAMIPFLEGKGFIHIKPKKVVFHGSRIIDEKEHWDEKMLGLMLPNVSYYNRSVSHLIHQELEDD